MQRVMKWSTVGIACLTAAGLGLYLFLVRTLDLERLRPALERQVSALAGRPFRIGGELTFALFPAVRLTFSEAHLTAPEGFSESRLLTIRSGEIRLKPLPLLAGELHVRRLILREPRLVLEVAPGGRKNWHRPPPAGIGPTAAADGAQGAPPAGRRGMVEDSRSAPPAILIAALARVTVSGGSLLWIDRSRGGERRQLVEELELVLRDPASASAVPFRLNGRMGERRFGLRGRLGPLGADRRLAKIPVELAFMLGRQVEGRLSGTLYDLLDAPRCDLALQSEPAAPRHLAEALGLTLAPWGAVHGPQHLVFRGRLRGTPERWAVSDGTLVLDVHPLRLGLVYDAAGEAPRLSINLRSERLLDLDAIFPGALPLADEAGPERARPAERRTPPAPAPATATQPQPPAASWSGLRQLLPAMATDLNLRAKAVQLRGLPLRNLAMDLAVAPDSLQVETLAGELYEGRFSGRGVLDLRGAKVAAQADLRLEQFDLGRLLRDMGEKVLVEGRAAAEFSLRLRPVPAGHPQPLRLLEGKGRLTLGDGALVGFDMGAMLQNREGAFGLMTLGQGRTRTDFTNLSLSFAIARGVLTTRDARLDAPDLQLAASGNVDLADEELGLLVVPGIASQGVRGAHQPLPVVVSGTFDVPVFRPDLSALADRRLEKKIVTSEQFKRAFQRPELKRYEEKARKLLQDLGR